MSRECAMNSTEEDRPFMSGERVQFDGGGPPVHEKGVVCDEFDGERGQPPVSGRVRGATRPRGGVGVIDAGGGSCQWGPRVARPRTESA